jgi:DNA anti-recombination protein RmuC
VSPTEAQVNKLFGMVENLTKQVDAMKNIIDRIAKNSDAILGESVLSIIKQHGTAIEHATRVLEKLSVRCPELRPETNEFPRVNGEGDAD